MNKKFLKNVFGLTVLCCSISVTAQVKIVSGHKAKSRIVITTGSPTDSTAAALMQDFVHRSTKAKLPIIPVDQVKKVKKGDILIGNGLSNASFVSDKLIEDGYLISTEDGILRIVSGGDGGSIYGVASFLEKYLGVYYWGEEEYSLNETSDLTVPSTKIIDNPAFIHRQTHFYGQSDPFYDLFNRYENPHELFAGGLWVHTFKRLLPSSVYGKDHPEFYSFYEGKRHPEEGAQWCLTNPELFEVVCAKLDSIFKANPDKKMISISQNDGDFAWCECEKCRALSEKEGALSGPYIHFMNKVAERFPDKEISTLAYHFTMIPPKHVKPRSNVNIFLCNIRCEREVPFQENETGRIFLKALEDWNKISDNIFVWDYGINFDNYVSPFPNFHIIGDNIRTCKENDVHRYFLQNSATVGTDFTELRTWITSRLMWNPYQDTDELILTFLKGYYGEASAPYLYRYIKLMEGGLLSSGIPLRIYDTPASHRTGMLNPKLFSRYQQLFNQAEKATEGNEVYLKRIQRTRLSLTYSELENLRDIPMKEGENHSAKVDYFENECKRLNVTRLNEQGNTPADYCKLYRERFANRTGNLALGAKVTYKILPSNRYDAIRSTALTDGVLGSYLFRSNWIGWEGTDADFTLDLGEVKEFSSIETDFLYQHYHWIFMPKKIRYSISTDGVHFEQAITKEVAPESGTVTKFVGVKHEYNNKQKARYIRIEVDGVKFIPAGACWFFIDEIIVH